MCQVSTAYGNRVSIHAPNEGSDIPVPQILRSILFQSTLPMKGATFQRAWMIFHKGFQSTLPMKGATG